ncbi:MAG TPA: endopeptidase La [Thermoanaerobaculia bacterium]|nr:endopeptidase La [Thermoanaerobaculia bacterium]
MSDTLKIPVLPLREAVIFPGVASPIGAGRPSTLRAIQAAVSGPDRLILAVCQRENRDRVTPELLYPVGTVAHIDQVQRSGGSTVQLLLDGKFRGRAVRFEEREGYLEAVVRQVEESLPAVLEDAAFVALQREVRERAAELGEKSGLPEEVVERFLASVEEPGRLADLVASYLELPAHEKQMILETAGVEERLRLVLLQVERQITVLDAQQEIKSKVQRELGDRQREMVLREQMKAIQQELGGGEDAGDLEELREKIEALDLPKDARKEVDRELGRLQRIARESMEYQVIRTYLETVVELPWNQRSDEHLDLREAARVLEEDHYGLEDVKDRVLEYLAVRQLRLEKQQARAVQEAAEAAAAADPEAEDVEVEAPSEVPGNPDDRISKGPILLFVGPPGVGKTSIAKSIARSMGREYVRVSLGGVRDEADVRGHRRTYVGAMPGRIVQGMRQAGTKNPVFLLDEVDKLGVSMHGDPASALLEVLDPAQNDTFVDHYLGIPFDLSEVLFIATANFAQNIPEPLYDRMELVEFTGYTESEKLVIARRFLWPRQLEEKALSEEQLALSDDAIREVITRYTREGGVRQLERALGKLARKVARRIAAREVETLELGPTDVAELLGRPKIRPEQAAREDRVGVATGMYYTPAGGDIMFVEAATMPGKGNLVLTGQLGEVMKESALAAWSWARSHADELGIESSRFERDVHVHVPAGAIRKDGPSAGITMATALVSSLAGRPVRHDLAMTGEITLTGTVLPIGGVKEKVLGAVRAGITEIVLPAENEGDLEDLPEEVRDKLAVHAVSDLSAVLSLALAPTAEEAAVLGEEAEGARPPARARPQPGLHH